MRFPSADLGFQSTMEKAWPLGSIFASIADTDPALLMGFGVWQSVGAGRCLVGFDGAQTEFDSLEKIGGAKTHTLATAEMPSHTHAQDPHNHTQDAHTHLQNPHSHVQNAASAATGPNVGSTPDTSTNTSVASGYSTAAATAVNQSTTATNQPATAVNQSTGGGAAHNNLQPYLVVRFWKRIG